MRLAKVGVFAAALVPLGWLVSGFLRNDLGVNPVETITHSTGLWALRFLLLSLAITPARKLLKRPQLIQFRRMLGLFAFFYATLHFLTWLWLDKMFDVQEMLADIGKRTFITAGTVALAAMAPLAVTSTAGWIRRLGGKRWQALHRLAYLAGLAAVLHYMWLVKSDIRAPGMYMAIFAALMLVRVWLNRARPAPSATIHNKVRIIQGIQPLAGVIPKRSSEHGNIRSGLVDYDS